MPSKLVHAEVMKADPATCFVLEDTLRRSAACCELKKSRKYLHLFLPSSSLPPNVPLLSLLVSPPSISPSPPCPSFSFHLTPPHSFFPPSLSVVAIFLRTMKSLMAEISEMLSVLRIMETCKGMTHNDITAECHNTTAVESEYGLVY